VKATRPALRNARLVAHVAPFYPPRLGGLERVAQALAELLAGQHEVEVVTTRRGGDDVAARERVNGVRVRRFRAREVAHTPLSPGMAVRLLTLPRGTVVHAHVAQAFVPETVWATSLLRRRPYIIHFHLDVDPSGPLGFLLSAYKSAVLGPVLRRAAAIIALSPVQAAFLAARYGVSPNRITVVPNGVDEAFFGLRERIAPRTPDQPLRLLFVGRLDAQKNVVRLLDAVSQASAPIELVVVGDGEHRALAEQRRTALGLTNVRFAGAQVGDALLAWYRWAHAFVLSSDKEGMPLVLLEAMASGLPVIATDVPGTRELVAGVGLLAVPSAPGLAAAIDRVATDPLLCAQLAERSARCGSSHSWTARIGELERLYEQVVPTP
jgi:glycosyltransferase involved in cell wall biosynthesis